MSVSKLDEIEAAAEALPQAEQQQLMLYLATRLRAYGARLPEPRKFSGEHMAEWVAEDEADLRHLKQRQ